MGAVKHILIALVYSFVGVVIGALALYTYQVGQWPDLGPWHRASLDEEFSASQKSEIRDLDAYRRLENRLFEQLQTQVVDNVSHDTKHRLNRYSAGSLVNPDNRKINWNRTFELPVVNPRAGILMLHGLSDSPYSMRSLADILYAQGIWVIALRIPGHGTAPAGLVHADWRDFTSATHMAARHLRQSIGVNPPLYILGYSNGAALAVEYSLSALENPALPAADTLVLLSAAIDVSPVAALASWQGKLSRLPGLEKFAWTPILPEFDPYKYNSFAVNAGEQIYELTTAIAQQMDRLAKEQKLDQFPRVLAFQSVADSTIPPDSVVEKLLRQLPPTGHELVLFDINRYSEAQSLLVSDPENLTQALLKDLKLPFDLTVVTNRNPNTHEVLALRKPPASNQISEEPLDLAWPDGVYSLSHVSLPFPPDDPLYGSRLDDDPNSLSLGTVEVRGETGLLVIPSGYFIRLRYNPFFSYLQDRVVKMLISGVGAS